ncbi:MAG: hypothetical protein ACOYNH_11495 [Bacteroidia bacterium]
MNNLSLIIPVIIYFTFLAIGFPYIKGKTKKYAIDIANWYILLCLMPPITLFFFISHKLNQKKDYDCSGS